MFRTLLISLILLVLISSLWSNLSYFIEVPIIDHSRGRFDTDLPVMQKPDEPMLPHIPLRILLPQGERFIDLEIEVRDSGKNISNIDIPFFGKQTPISRSKSILDALSKDENHSSGIYPSDLYNEFGTHRKMGYEILIVNLYPYLYDIDNRVLHKKDSFNLQIITEYDSQLAAQQNTFLLNNQSAREEIRRLVINPEIIDTYVKTPIYRNSILPNENDPYSMIVITDAIRAPYFDNYISWKTDNNISSKVFLLEDIYSSYSGVDNQEKIRNFIIDAYETYSLSETPLEYVLLGGDDVIVPVRGMYCFVSGLWTDYEDYNIPSDVYYSNLDGNWDANGNGIYGELDDGIDWFAEIAIGRIPAVSEQDFNNFFQKNIHYGSSPSYSNDIAIMIGQNLDAITWGGDYKDEIIPILPDDYHITTFYEKDGSYSGEGIREAVRNGLGILNHLGHSNENTVFGMNNYQVNQLQNSEYGLAYSQGCYTAAFDNATNPDSDAIGQRMVNAEGGFFAFIGNTRYGWYWPGSTEGASQLFDLTFFKGLFEQDIRHIGKTLNYSKETLVNEAIDNNFQHHLWQNGFMLWTFYNQILLGDPSAYLRPASGQFPYLEPISMSYDDYLGDGDGMVNPGETIRIYLELANREDWSDAFAVRASFTGSDQEIEVITGESEYPCIPAGDKAFNSTPFVISLSHDVPYGDYEFTIRVSALGNDEHEFVKDYNFLLPVTIKQQYWPWQSNTTIQGAPLIHEEDPFFTKIIAIDAINNIDYLDFRAENVIPSFSYDGNMMKSAAMGDLFNNGNPIVVFNNRSGLISGIDLQGNEVFSYNSDSQFINTPILADMTGDGLLEIVTHSIDRKLFVISATGDLLPDYPKQLDYNVLVELAAADINDNGSVELIIGYVSGILDVIDLAGNSLDGFPVDLQSPINLSPIVLVNKNIVTGTQNNRLKMISPTGVVLWEKQLPNRIITEPIAADFTGDDVLEIAFNTSDGKVYIINQEGETLAGYPFSISEAFNQPPLAVDVNNDGHINLIVASYSGLIYGLNPDATIIDMLPAPLGLQPTSPLFIADIDRDGDFEIGFGTNLGISVLDYKFYAGEDTPWSIYRGNTMRTGYYNDNNIFRENKYLPEPPNTELMQNYPNPFNISTTIPYHIKSPGTLNISIYNIKGQKIRQLHNAHAERGYGEVIWNGRNDEGKIVASGIYFTKMTIGKTTQVRKMLLLK
ncbi:MAG: T9SS type A sorting domain-containing protein [Candidatus Cloacimonetes bacterium]|nr:T9SS type A sorting domain-containing protein [Candidatus Cloacimonadota bacterium]